MISRPVWDQAVQTLKVPETPDPKNLGPPLRQVIAAGALPFACFTIFGPHGQRLLRRQTFMGYQLNVATGEWAKREQPGPRSYHAWHRCWRVCRAAMVLLEGCDVERLDNYAEMIRNFATQFGDETWFLISKADAQMRSEQMERLRRQLRSAPDYGYTVTTRTATSSRTDVELKCAAITMWAIAGRRRPNANVR